MKRWGPVLLGVVMIFAAMTRVAGTEPQAAGAPSVSPMGRAAAQVIWTGKSGGFAIRWTTADIQARPEKRPGQLAFSAAQWQCRAAAAERRVSSLRRGAQCHTPTLLHAAH